jgi:hypothetical protein
MHETGTGEQVAQLLDSYDDDDDDGDGGGVDDDDTYYKIWFIK